MERSVPMRKPHTSTVDLLTWSKTPPSESPTADFATPAHRTHKSVGAISPVMFGTQPSEEEAASLNERWDPVLFGPRWLGLSLIFLGFSVQPARVSSQDVDEEPFCYGGKASLESIADSWRDLKSSSPRKTKNSRVFEDFQQRVGEMPISEMVSWAVGGLVLIAGLLFISKRKSYSHRPKQAAILRTARKLEARINQQPRNRQR